MSPCFALLDKQCQNGVRICRVIWVICLSASPLGNCGIKLWQLVLMPRQPKHSFHVLMCFMFSLSPFSFSSSCTELGNGWKSKTLTGEKRNNLRWISVLVAARICFRHYRIEMLGMWTRWVGKWVGVQNKILGMCNNYHFKLQQIWTKIDWILQIQLLNCCLWTQIPSCVWLTWY